MPSPMPSPASPHAPTRPDPAASAHRPVGAGTAAWVGLLGLASAMGVGRFAFTPMLPLMQQAGTLTLAQGGALARANYLGYLLGALASLGLARFPGRAARIGLVAVALLTAGMGLTASYPLWVILRLLAGVASAFVLVGVSSWALPILAARGRGSWAGWIYAGVGTGIVVCGLVGLVTGVRGVSPDTTWLLLGALSAVVAVACLPSLRDPAPAGPVAPGRPRGRLDAESWRLVLAYATFGFGYIVPATFLPAAARQVVPDPAVFAWTWPVFGLAAALSTLLVSRWLAGAPPRRLWAGSQLVMALGVLVPAAHTSVGTLLFSATAVGGTFMVLTMSGIQEARRVAAASAPRLISAMTAAFALGQLVGPYTVTTLGSASSPGIAVPLAIAAAVLLVGLVPLAGRGGPARR